MDQSKHYDDIIKSVIIGKKNRYPKTANFIKHANTSHDDYKDDDFRDEDDTRTRHPKIHWILRAPIRPFAYISSIII